MTIKHVAGLVLALSLTTGAAHAQAQFDPLAPLKTLVNGTEAAARSAGLPTVRRHVTHHAAHQSMHSGHHFVAKKVAVPNRLRTAKPRAAKVDQFKLAEREGFKKVSDLTKGAFPPFYPTLGIVTVKPETLPVGPFRCFDAAGNLVSTVYMLSLEDMNKHQTWDKVAGLPAPVDHATAYFHPGHAGVQYPHYHLVLWHVKNEAAVAK